MNNKTVSTLIVDIRQAQQLTHDINALLEQKMSQRIRDINPSEINIVVQKLGKIKVLLSLPLTYQIFNHNIAKRDATYRKHRVERHTILQFIPECQLEKLEMDAVVTSEAFISTLGDVDVWVTISQGD